MYLGCVKICISKFIRIIEKYYLVSEINSIVQIMLRKLLPLCFVFTLGLSTANSQVTLSMYPGGNPLTEDTVTLGSTVNFKLTVQNDGPSVFSGVVLFKWTINDTTPFPDTIASLNTSGIAVSDTESVFGSFITAPMLFTGGVNVVVIWPYAPGVIVGDSIIDTLWILNHVSMDNPEVWDDRIKVFPNPFTKELTLQMHDPGQLSNMRLFDANGRKLSAYVERNKLLVGDLPKGMYLLRIELRDGSLITRKLIKR